MLRLNKINFAITITSGINDGFWLFLVAHIQVPRYQGVYYSHVYCPELSESTWPFIFFLKTFFTSQGRKFHEKKNLHFYLFYSLQLCPQVSFCVKLIILVNHFYPLALSVFEIGKISMQLPPDGVVGGYIH